MDGWEMDGWEMNGWEMNRWEMDGWEMDERRLSKGMKRKKVRERSEGRECGDEVPCSNG